VRARAPAAQETSDWDASMSAASAVGSERKRPAPVIIGDIPGARPAARRLDPDSGGAAGAAGGLDESLGGADADATEDLSDWDASESVRSAGGGAGGRRGTPLRSAGPTPLGADSPTSEARAARHLAGTPRTAASDAGSDWDASEGGTPARSGGSAGGGAAGSPGAAKLKLPEDPADPTDPDSSRHGSPLPPPFSPVLRGHAASLTPY
jgi:hypothetical protein